MDKVHTNKYDFPILLTPSDSIVYATISKPPNEILSNRSIWLLRVISKLLAKYFLKDDLLLQTETSYQTIGYHSTLDQVHKITNAIEKSLEDPEVFFYRLCLCSTGFSQLLKSYISDSAFRDKQTRTLNCKKEVLQGNKYANIS